MKLIRYAILALSIATWYGAITEFTQGENPTVVEVAGRDLSKVDTLGYAGLVGLLVFAATGSQDKIMD